MSLARMRRAVAGSWSLKLLLAGVGILLLVLYFRLFQVPGIRFYGTFLTKTGDASEAHYRGRSQEGKFHITVKGEKNKDREATVLYELPNRIKLSHGIEFTQADTWEDSFITVSEGNGDVVFTGNYNRYDPILMNANGEPDWGQMRVSYNGNSMFVPGYKAAVKESVDLAVRADETIRGKWDFLLLALFIFAAVGLDMAFPLLGFSLSHRMWVENAEPSDAYLFMQRLGWVVMPILGLVIMVVAVW